MGGGRNGKEGLSAPGLRDGGYPRKVGVVGAADPPERPARGVKGGFGGGTHPWEVPLRCVIVELLNF